jgi:hypothetical protein
MSDEDRTRPGVRIGGWVPPLGGSHPRTFPDHVPASGPGIGPRSDPGEPVLIASHRRRTPWVGLAVLAVVAAAGAVALAQGPDGRPQVAVPGTVVLPSVPQLSAVPFLPLPPTETVAATTAPPTPPPTAPAVTSSRVRLPAPRPSAPPLPQQPPPARVPPRQLTVGATVGLQPVGRDVERLRHRHFVGRIDRIGHSASATDRADARFVVRPGLADGRCVSLESVNYPRHYLRHQNFTLRLHPWDHGGLYAADATFCPVRGRDGGSLTLRSVNYPDRYLAAGGDSVVRLLRPAERAPTAFVVRRPV